MINDNTNKKRNRDTVDKFPNLYKSNRLAFERLTQSHHGVQKYQTLMKLPEKELETSQQSIKCDKVMESSYNNCTNDVVDHDNTKYDYAWSN